MPRKLRVEFPGAIYHVMSRGDRREDIFKGDVDRQDFLKTLAETCQKAGFEVHAEELKRLGWTEADLPERRKSDPDKLAMAARLRRETTLTVSWIAHRLTLGTRKSAVMKLHRRSKDHQRPRPKMAKTMV